LLVKPEGIPPSRGARTPDAGSGTSSTERQCPSRCGIPSLPRAPPTATAAGANLPRLPNGVGHYQTSARLKGLAVPFAVLGMSYGAVTAALVALGWPLSKVAVSYAVQALGGTGRRDRGRDQQRR
jgi:hypothetical protein